MELVILIGVPASGKSSFVRARLAPTHRHVSRDLLGPGRRRAGRQRALIEEALSAGQPVVVDNVNATVADRAALIAQGRAHGARIVGYYFESAVRAAVARNRARVGTERVPDVAIYVAARRVERPSPAEGFDALYRVRLGAAGGFEVTGWAES
jgi:predicted kinase